MRAYLPKTLSGALATSVGVLVLCGALAAIKASVRTLDAYRPTPPSSTVQPPPFVGMTPRTVTLATLGHRRTYDRMLSLWLVQLLGSREIWRARPEVLWSAVAPILAHAPRVESIYLFACTAFNLVAKQPERCEAITKVGVTAVPDSWMIPMVQGYIFHKKLNDPARAGAYYLLASKRPGSPGYLKPSGLKLLAAARDGAGADAETSDSDAGAEELLRAFEVEDWQEEGSAP